MEAVPIPLRGNVPLEDETEALAARAGDDPQAFGELYVRFREPVFRYLRARCGSDDDALELAAVTFERAFVAIPRYRSRGGGLLAWLFRIARNAAIDEARRRKRTAVESEVGTKASAEASVDAVVLANEERRRLLALLDDLPDHLRDAIALRYGAGLTAREIGAVIGKSEAATQKLISRALARLREEFDD